MACFKRLSDSFYSIQRSEKAQSLIFPTSLIPELYEKLSWCQQEALKRLEDGNLPDTQSSVGAKIICRVMSVHETGAVRIDIREWYTSLSGALNPTRRGVNLSLEQLTLVYSEIEEFVSAEKEKLVIAASKAALHDGSTPASHVVQIVSVEDDLSAKKQSGKRKQPATKKKAQPKKQQKKPKQTVVISDDEDLIVECGSCDSSEEQE